jgi:hypothetical protein
MDDRDTPPEESMEKPVHELSALLPAPTRLEAMAQGVVARALRGVAVDLAPLMPSPKRLETMTRTVVTRLAARQTRMRDALPRQLLRWSAPMLAAGVGLAACLWLVGVTPNETAYETSADPTSVFTQWAMSNDAPTATHIFETLGDEDAQ